MLPLAAGATGSEEDAATVMAKGKACPSILHGSARSYTHTRVVSQCAWGMGMTSLM